MVTTDQTTDQTNNRPNNRVNLEQVCSWNSTKKQTFAINNYFLLLLLITNYSASVQLRFSLMHQLNELRFQRLSSDKAIKGTIDGNKLI